MGADKPYRKPQDLVGQRLAQYQVERIVGKGGMGTVFEAVEPALDRKVALKVLSPEASESQETVDRFKREAKVLAQIEHPHVVKIYQLGRVGRVLFIAQEFVDGTDYETIVERDGPMDLRESLAVIDQVASALEAVHDLGVIHRDLKPGNVMRRSDGVTKVLDFGIAKPIQASLGPDITRAGMFLGTLGYCSPEQIRGDRLTVRSDVYSLGVTLYFFLTGEAPNKGAGTEEMLAETLQGKLVPIRKRRADLAHPVVRLVEQMIHRDASKRPATAAVVRSRVIEVLEQLDAAEGDAGPPPPGGLLGRLARLFGRR